MKPNRLLFIGTISIMGAISFINNSGFATSIDSNNRTAYLLFTVSFILALKELTRTTNFSKNKLLFWFVGIVAVMGSSYLAGYTIDGFRFLTYFLCIYLVSKLCFDEKNLKLLSLIYGILTGVILFVSSFGSLLAGWNSNSLAIQGFQMLMIFCIGFNNDYKRIKEKRGIWTARGRMIVFFGLILYASILMETLNCRSASLSCIVTLILMIKNEAIVPVLRNKKALLVLVLAPCIVAFFVVAISDLPRIAALNNWSMQQFHKPIFNGRDYIWKNGLNWFYSSPVYGKGNLNYGNWHNSAVACLAGFGAVGYFIYIKVFSNTLSKATFYIEDVFVRKGMIAFLLLNFQQSFENTICQSKLMILHPYIVLGLVMGRCLYLEYERRS